MSQLGRWTDRLVDRALRGAREAHDDEEGGSMVFGAITLFTLVLFSWMVYAVGMASGDRIQLQNAADSAAYSGALVEAESLESIGFLNDGMAWVYYAGCRYAIDEAVYATLAVFYYHDAWVYKFEGSRLSDVDQMHNLEMDVGVINPGARDQNDPLGSSGGGQGNYVPPPSADATPTTLDYGWALLGQGGTQIFTSRFQLAQQHAANLIAGKYPRAKYWIQDIHYAERIILAATPNLVTKTCVRVARANRPVQNQGDGHFFVAVSDDLDSVWRLDNGSDTTKNQLAGFTDNTKDKTVSDALANRYAKQDNPVDKKQVDYPSWFDKSTGKLSSPYSQTRICWNKRDWQHESSGPQDHSSVATYSHFNSPNQQPAGHWHARHYHRVNQLDQYTGEYDIPVTPLGANFKHDQGHGMDDGPDAQAHSFYPDDTQNPLQPDYQFDQSDQMEQPDHHMAQPCPTCGNVDNGKEYVSVRHDSDDAVQFMNTFYNQSSGGAGAGGGQTAKTDYSTWMQFSFDDSSSGGGGGGAGGGSGTPTFVLPKLLLARPPLFRAGVTVAVWTPSVSVGTTFAGSPFGMFAIASAQIGVRTPGDGQPDTITVVDEIQGQRISFKGGTPSELDLSKDGRDGSTDGIVNFYLGEGDGTTPGARWGARLVPIGRRLTWADDGSSGGSAVSNGLKKLLSGKRWFRSADDVPDKGAALGDSSMAGTVPDPDNAGQQVGVDQLLARWFDAGGGAQNGQSGQNVDVGSVIPH